MFWVIWYPNCTHKTDQSKQIHGGGTPFFRQTQSGSSDFVIINERPSLIRGPYWIRQSLLLQLAASKKTELALLIKKGRLLLHYLQVFFYFACFQNIHNRIFVLDADQQKLSVIHFLVQRITLPIVGLTSPNNNNIQS